VPNLTDPDHLRQWQLIEVAKHRFIYTLLQMKLPLVSKLQDRGQQALSFDFLTDELTPSQKGFNRARRRPDHPEYVNEADDDKRELSRKANE
jgi:hypothetical protein